jgi:hypothetical protein
MGAQVGHPAVAVWLALGAAAVAAAVVAMAWSVHAREIRLAELLVRRQFLVLSQTSTAPALDEGGPDAEIAAELEAAARARSAPPQVIEGPDSIVSGEQARYRVRPNGQPQTVSWAVGGGPVSQTPDPSHPEELLLIAEQPGELTITVRVREGLAERRESKTVTVVPDVTPATPPFTLRLFLHGWGLVALAVLIVGFAGALNALGNFTSSDFIALVVPLAALLGVIAVARGGSEAGSGHECGYKPGHGHSAGHGSRRTDQI